MAYKGVPKGYFSGLQIKIGPTHTHSPDIHIPEVGLHLAGPEPALNLGGGLVFFLPALLSLAKAQTH